MNFRCKSFALYASYAAPEWFRYHVDKFEGCSARPQPSDDFGLKSEIYSLGVVLLEILTGMKVYDVNRPDRKQDLVKWATPLLSDTENLRMIMDPQLLDNDHPPKGGFKLAVLVSKCLQNTLKKRPSKEEILQVLCECYLEETKTIDS